MTTVRTEVQLPIQRTASPPVEPTVRVASVPVDHAYVRHLAPVTPGLTSMVGLPDQTPVGEAGPADALWWPPTMLDADWVDAHHDEFDVFHVHFGFDTMDATDLGRLVETLRRHGKPLVHTVHDLRSAHHQSGAPFEHLDVLVPAADALITLTPGAAAEIERRWARPALVLPHPHVVPLEDMPQLQARSALGAGRPFTVGVRIENLRPGMDPLPVIDVLVQVLRDIPETQLRVDGHRSLLDNAGARFDPQLAGALRAWHSGGEIELCVHDSCTDAERWDYLADIDVSVLPYRFGTHSGWLEACHDIGTRVIAPTSGFFSQQGPVASYRWTSPAPDAPLDAQSLAAAVYEVYNGGVAVPAQVSHRAAQRDAVAVAHDRLYRSLLGRQR